MSTPSVDQMQAQAFEYVRQGQETLMRLAGTATENWAAMMRGAGGTGPNGGTNPAGGLLEAVGTPAQLVDRSFDLGIQVLEAQRALVQGLLEAATSPLQATAAPGAGRAH